jgi:phosphoribosylanthranilate isomerase
MVNIKICGMTNLEDCQTAIDLGVEFVGFVFYKKSARYVTPEMVKEISERISGKAKTVGVFVEETEDEIDRLVDFCRLDFAQVYNRPHGAHGANRIIAYRVRDRLPEVSTNGLILFDSYSEGFGGSGTSFDVNVLEGHGVLERAFIAGGIDEGNVYPALDRKPFGVDLVSSVEKEKGKKDPFKMERLVKKVRSYQI